MSKKHTAFEMAKRIVRSKRARWPKDNDLHRARELIEWGLKFVDTGMRQLPTDVGAELHVHDIGTRETTTVPVAINTTWLIGGLSFYRDEGGRLVATLWFPTGVEAQKSKPRAELTVIDGGLHGGSAS